MVTASVAARLARLVAERDCLLGTSGVYDENDTIIVNLNYEIRELIRTAPDCCHDHHRHHCD